MILGKRGVTNIVATMLIFGIMIASIGVLYGQIAPTILGYETTTTTTNQNFIFETVAQNYLKLASSSDGAVSLVHIISENTEFDMLTSTQLSFSVLDSGLPISTNTTRDVSISSFQSTVSGAFQPANTEILNRVADTSVYINNNTGDANYILSANYGYSQGVFDIYFRSRIDVHSIGINSWKMTITVLQIDFTPSIDGTPSAFPVSIPEWTLRMRRQPSQLTTDTVTVNGPITVSHSLNTVSAVDYNFPSIQSGDNLQVDVIIIPILFGV